MYSSASLDVQNICILIQAVASTEGTKPSSMAFIHPPALRIPLLTFQPHSSSTRILTFFPKLLFKNPRNSLYIVSCSTPKAIPATEQEVLDAIAESDEKSLPAVRSFENDLARLTMVGAIDVEQALTAAAADGGNTADEHIASGMAAMVVETVFPGASDEHSTVSTRLVSIVYGFVYTTNLLDVTEMLNPITLYHLEMLEISCLPEISAPKSCDGTITKSSLYGTDES